MHSTCFHAQATTAYFTNKEGNQSIETTNAIIRNAVSEMNVFYVVVIKCSCDGIDRCIHRIQIFDGPTNGQRIRVWTK